MLYSARRTCLHQPQILIAMSKNSFNPEAWQDMSKWDEVVIVLDRIDAAKVDITKLYSDWRDLGFAFTSEFGPAGITLFNRVSQHYPDYDPADVKDQYEKCLRSKGSGITLKTFFYNAQQAGVDIRVSKSPMSPISPLSPMQNGSNSTSLTTNNDCGDNGETGDIGEKIDLPTFSDRILDQLPEFLQQVAKYGGSVQETDALLLGALGVISGCLPNIFGIYGGATVYANLFFFITARAASGKGNLKFCRNLVEPIHERERKKYEDALALYETEMQAWEAASKKQRGEKPKRPYQTMLFISANNSATSFYQLLNENGERAIMFEPEADCLSQSLQSDFGNYSDGFRRAFHHEWISYHRRGGNEDVEVKKPRLSVVLTGTPQQVVNLIPSAENGLFSRFGFYRIESPLQWNDVLGQYEEEGLDSIFDTLGKLFCEFYDELVESKPLRFRVTESQRMKFNEYFSSLQQEYYSIFKDDIIGSVRRLGLICFRVAMVLSALRMWENAECVDELYCLDEDFDSALTICRVLAVHMAKVFEELSSSDGSRTAMLANSERRQRFFTALQDEFSRQDYLEVAERLGVPEDTADKWIKAFWSKLEILEKVDRSHFRKK